MNRIVPRVESMPIDSPGCDGNRRSDHRKPGRGIFSSDGNGAALLGDRADAVVAADTLWYPVRSRPDRRSGVDGSAVLGRPGGDRPSCKQWQGDEAVGRCPETAGQRANAEQQHAGRERRRFVRLADLSRQARGGRATPDELRELQSLEEADRPSEA